LGFVTTILVTDLLGNAYGLFLGAQRFVALFLVIAQFGLHPLLVRAIASRTAAPGPLIGTALALRGVLAPVFLLTIAIGVEAGGYLPDHRWLVWAFVGIELVGVVVETFLALCEGLERMGRSALVAMVRSALTAAGIVVVLMVGGGLPAVVAAYAVGRLVQLVVAVVLTRSAVGELRLSVIWARVPPMVREALPFIAIAYGYVWLRSLDIVFLTRLSTTAEAARYGAALNFFEVLVVAPHLVQRVLLPAFSRLEAGSGGAGMARNVIETFYLVLLPSVVGLVLLAPQAVALYPSGEFSAAAPVLQALAPALLFLPPVTVCASHLTAAGRLRQIIAAYGVALPLQVVANLLLIPRYGAVGAAMATVLAYGTLAAALVVASLGLGIRFPWASIGRQMLAAGLMGGCVFAINDLPVLIPVALGAIVYVAAVLLLAPSSSLERRLLTEVMARLSKR
jgi:O-antigen/teichoic acid export membrane protein